MDKKKAKPVKEAKPVDEKPAEEKPAEIKPTEEKPTEEKPAEIKPTEEKPTEEKPTEGEDASFSVDTEEKEEGDDKVEYPSIGDMIVNKARDMVDNVTTIEPKPSEHMIPALARFYTAVPRLAFKKSLDGFVIFVTVFLDKTFEKFGIVFNELEGPEYEKNIEKGRVVARKIATVYKDIFTDPELLRVVKEMLKTYLDFIKEFLRMIMLMVKERAFEAVDTGSQVAEKVWIKFGNAVLNAIQSVIPGVGNVMGLIRSIHGVIIGIQEATKEGTDFYLQTQSKFINIMRKISTPAFSGAESSIDAFQVAQKLYFKATKAIDELAKTVENVADDVIKPDNISPDKIINEVEQNLEEQKKEDEDFKKNYGKT